MKQSLSQSQRNDVFGNEIETKEVETAVQQNRTDVEADVEADGLPESLSNRPIRLAHCCTRNSNLSGLRFFMLHLHDNVHSHLYDMEILGTKRFIPKGFELGTTLSLPNRSISSQPEKIKARTNFHFMSIPQFK